MSTAQDNFDKGVQLRLEGNEAFKKQEFKQALTHYYNALLHLKAVGGQKEEAKFKQQSTEQLIMIYNNMSNVFAKQERWDRVLFYASKANELEPDNTKSKFRIAQAHSRNENFELAKPLLEEVLKQNPSDELVKKELAKIAEADKLMDQKEKSIYRAMMAKLAEEKK